MTEVGWNQICLEDIAVVERGKFSARPRNDPKYYGGNIPFLQTGDVAKSNGKITSFSQTLNELGLQVSKLFPKGTLLISIAANIGDIAEVDFDFACPDSLVAIRPRPGIDKNWLKYFLQTKKQHFESLATQNAQANINLQVIRPLLVDIPPFEEQRQIAAILSTWDTAIEKTGTLIEAKLTAKRDLMRRLLMCKRRLKGFTNLWKEYHLGDLFTERVETGYDHLPLLSITREEGVILRNDVDRKDTSSEDKSRYLRIYPGDIGYNTMRMWQGVSALSSFEGIVSPAYTICTPKDGVDGQFMAYFFKLPRIIHLFYRYSQGLTSDTWNLKFHHFKEIKVTIPEQPEQKAIAQVLKTSDAEIRLLHKQLDAFKTQKRGLMQKLLTGEWRATSLNIGQ